MQLSEMYKSEYKPICDYVCDTEEMAQKADKKTPELEAVMNEFAEKARALRDIIENGSTDDAKEALIEVEQAADSAKRFVENSDDLDKDLSSQIKTAHDRVSAFKHAKLH